ncbi:MAG: methyl-accepting chemotaxis protein [Euryarchaeota archaeon]|nr:methyl-accepting chemotaxis protein [Euryarchaeota archaeon]
MTLKTKKRNLLEFKSIKTKLMVIIAVMFIIGGTALTGVAALMATNALQDAQHKLQQAIGESTSQKLEILAEDGKDTVSIFATDSDVISWLISWNEGSFTPEEQIVASKRLLAMLDKAHLFERINVVDNQGIVIAASSTENIGKDYSDRDVVVHQQKEAYIGDPYVGADGTPRIPYAQPVYDDNGQQIGLVYIALDLPAVDGLVFSTPGLSEVSANFLVGPDGTILSGVNGDYSAFLTKKFDLQSIFSAGETIAKAPGYYGIPAYIVKTPVPGTDWFVITTERTDEVNRPIMELITMMVASLFIVIVAGLLVAVFIANSFARPIQALTENARKLALGDVNVSITHTGTDEIGHLADAFRNIAENTKKRVDFVLKIASGDVEFRVIAASDKDVEGHTLIQLKQTVANLADSLEILAHRAAEGDLSYRAEADQFEGVYRTLIETMNHAFDLIIIPVQETMRLSTSYSSGDYSDRFDPDIMVKGDFVPFKAALDQIGTNSSDALLKIRTGVHDISAGASESSISVEEIASSVVILAENSSHVSLLTERNEAGLDQAFTAMNDLAHTVGEVAGRTASVSELASKTSNLAHDGAKRAKLAGNGMEEIMESFEKISSAVSDMSNQMDEIGGIVDVISGIADQTNLLALNAAIEAARAGDAGLGFTVVANEVKALAQDSQTSAEHIGVIIEHLQKMSVEVTAAMGKASDVMESGNNAVHETVTIFNQMAEAIGDVNRNMSEVAAASEEQAASVQEITASMSEVRDMVQDTSKQATDSAAAAEEISALLDGLKHTSAQSAQLAEKIEGQVNLFKIE